MEIPSYSALSGSETRTVQNPTLFFLQMVLSTSSGVLKSFPCHTSPIGMSYRMALSSGQARSVS